ncbi:MAG TPA: PEP-CTERM sorting domain-containing protein [Lamprocystis sp. (in: g-proteobacteria)]|nr:PEP-CTERM sorting domain-containing protein [Lamprocystis sp. (in: g-proteobacteria)]
MIRREIKTLAATGLLALGGALTGVPPMRRFMTPLLFGASLLGLGITNAGAAIVLLDNTSGLTDTAYNSAIQTGWGSNTPAYNRINGRVFTTGTTAYLLDSVSLLLRDNAPLNDMTWRVSLWALGGSDTTPAGGASPAYQESFSGINLTTAAAYITFSPTSDWLMAANSRYAIGFANNIGDAFTGWGGTTTSGAPTSTVGFSYNNGFFSTTGGSAFSSTGNSGYTFQLTGSEPALAPAPPTWALFALGALVAGVTRRRQRRAAAR